MIIDFVSKYFYYIFLGLILLTVLQRRYRGTGDKKRFAVLIASILFFIMYIGAMGIKSKNLDQSWLLLPLAVCLSLVYVLRNRLFIFKTTCIKCGKKLSGTDILYIDSNLCSECAEAAKAADKAGADNDQDENADKQADEECSDGSADENPEKE